MTKAGGGDGTLGVRVSQLECRANKAEDEFKIFLQNYNDDRLWRAEWRGKLDVVLEGIKKDFQDVKHDLQDVKATIGRRRSDRIKIWVAVIVAAGALATSLLDKFN